MTVEGYCVWNTKPSAPCIPSPVSSGYRCRRVRVYYTTVYFIGFRHERIEGQGGKKTKQGFGRLC